MAIEDLLEEDALNTRVYTWFRRHGVSVVMGVVIGLTLIGGRFFWSSHQHRADEAVFQRYERLVEHIESKSLDHARAELAQLASSHASLLTQLAGLQLTKAYVDQGRLADAVHILERLPSSPSDALYPVIQQRLARLWLASNKPAQAVVCLKDLHDSLSQEILGDAYVAMGQLRLAQTAYSAAFDASDPLTTQAMIVKAKRDEVSEPAGHVAGTTP